MERSDTPLAPPGVDEKQTQNAHKNPEHEQSIPGDSTAAPLPTHDVSLTSLDNDSGFEHDALGTFGNLHGRDEGMRYWKVRGVSAV